MTDNEQEGAAVAKTTTTNHSPSHNNDDEELVTGVLTSFQPPTGRVISGRTSKATTTETNPTTGPLLRIFMREVTSGHEIEREIGHSIDLGSF